MMESNVDKTIWEIYKNKKHELLSFVEAGNPEAAMNSLTVLRKFMNRFRNCDLQFYFDEDLHDAIAKLNTHRFDTTTRLRSKSTYRIAFVVPGISETGGASIVHRFMLSTSQTEEVEFEQYLLVTNQDNSDAYTTEDLINYLPPEMEIAEAEYFDSGLGWLEKGLKIQNWIYEREIDFVVTTPCPSTLYALSSRPALLVAVITQDCLTFSLGPGFGDMDYFVSVDQVYKYDIRGSAPEERMKLVKMPLHESSYVEQAIPLKLEEFGIPDNAVVSGSTNIWKSTIGDTTLLFEVIAALIRRHPHYHHIFAGTRRGLDNLDVFLSQNSDVKNNFHYVGAITNIYRLLKAIDFWINSFPVSGTSDIESAFVGKPSIEWINNRNLTWQAGEMLRSRECEVISQTEFVALGSRFISDPSYRLELGSYLKQRVAREYDKETLLKERVYGYFVEQYQQKLAGRSTPRGIGVVKTIEYEKRIALYGELSNSNKQTKQKFLTSCQNEFPDRPFAWIKGLEESFRYGDLGWYASINKSIPDTLAGDYRINLLLSLWAEKLGDLREALVYSEKSVCGSDYDEYPKKVCARIRAKNKDISGANMLLKELGCRELILTDEVNLNEIVINMFRDSMPVYYDY